MVMRTPVRVVGRMAPPRRAVATPAEINPFSITSIMQAFAEMTAMHDKVLKMVADLEAKHAQFDDIKKGPAGTPGLPGPRPNHDQIVADVLQQVRQPVDGKSPEVSALAAALLPLMVKHFAKIVPKVKDGLPGTDAKPVDTNALLDQMFEEIKSGKRKLGVAHIDGLDTKFAEVRNAAAMGTPEIYGKNTWKRGGGDTVVAGPGVIITEVNGNKKISVPGGGLTIIAITGVIDDTNLTFGSATEPTLLNINGAFYQKAAGAYTWSWAATVITLNQPVGAGGSIFGI